MNTQSIVSKVWSFCNTEFGKKWRADFVDICDGTDGEEWKFQKYLEVRLKSALWGEQISVWIANRMQLSFPIGGTRYAFG
jgi:hypothetical protein